MTASSAPAEEPDLSDPAAAGTASVAIGQATRPVLPILVVLDTSSSMAPHLGAMQDAAVAALDAAWSNALGPSATVLSVLTAGAEATVVVPLGPPTAPGELPPLVADGLADLDGAITLLAEDFERVQQQRLGRGQRLLRPWVLLVSDGRWKRGDAAAAIRRLHAPPTRPVVCPIGVGDVDETVLARVATDVGYAVDTADDLAGVMAALVRDVLAGFGETDGGGPVHAPDAPRGSRPLEGW